MIDMIYIYLMHCLIYLFHNMYYQKVKYFMSENNILIFWPYIFSLHGKICVVFLFDFCVISNAVISTGDDWDNLENGLQKNCMH